MMMMRKVRVNQYLVVLKSDAGLWTWSFHEEDFLDFIVTVLERNHSLQTPGGDLYLHHGLFTVCGA